MNKSNCTDAVRWVRSLQPVSDEYSTDLKYSNLVGEEEAHECAPVLWTTEDHSINGVCCYGQLW